VADLQDSAVIELCCRAVPCARAVIDLPNENRSDARFGPTKPRACGGILVALIALLALVGCGKKESALKPVASTGERIYNEYCAVCHMPDGGGVQNFQPALRGNAIVAGDPAKLETVIRAGSAALRDREPLYAAEMPPFGTLTDEEVKAVTAYVRQRFGSPPSGKAP
jgi:mono/diheme cytochrome c family protein